MYLIDVLNSFFGRSLNLSILVKMPSCPVYLVVSRIERFWLLIICKACTLLLKFKHSLSKLNVALSKSLADSGGSFSGIKLGKRVFLHGVQVLKSLPEIFFGLCD